MNVFCFGGSNTYGYDPRSWPGGRYDADSRWVDIVFASGTCVPWRERCGILDQVT